MRGMQCIAAVRTAQHGCCRSWRNHTLLPWCRQRFESNGNKLTRKIRSRDIQLCRGRAPQPLHTLLTLVGQINLRPTAASSGTGHVSLLYRSEAANKMWESLYFTFAPDFKQTREFMLQKQTLIKYGVDGMPPSASLDSRSEETSGLVYTGGYLRLGELDSTDPVVQTFILRAIDTEQTSTVRYFMTVPNVFTTIGGALTAVLYVVLTPLALFCLWQTCRGESLLDTIAFKNSQSNM